MNEQQFADKYLQECKPKKNEIEAKFCLFCGGGRHHDEYTFSINTNRHTYNCLRGSCGESGTFGDLCEKYGEAADYREQWLKENNKQFVPAQEYLQPKYKVEELSSKVINYFVDRGISQDTLVNTKVKSMQDKYAVFQFFEGDKLVMNKIRLARVPEIVNGRKEMKEWKEPGGKHVLWNMNNIDKTKPVILTEGMIDALSVIEAGETNVVSIPSGTNDMTWIQNSYDWITTIKKWIIYIDNDVAGTKLKDELLIKFKSYRCKVVKHELKDANEELQTFGTKYIKDVISKAEIPAVMGISDIAAVKLINPANMERCLTGISIIDKYAGGFIFPSLNVWTGERGSGKSTVLSQTLLNCIDRNYKVFVYSGELMGGYFKLWLCNQALGEKNVHKTIDKETQATDYSPNESMMATVNKWLSGKMYIFDDTNTNEEDKLMLMMEEAYKRYNCRVFVIDNLMTIKFKPGKDIYRAQSDFVDRLRLFVKNNNLIVNLVVHPNKAGNISGANDIRNAAFNEFWVRKLDGNKDTDFPGYNTLITVTKNRYYGKTDIFKPYYFSNQSKRIYEVNENERTYGWDTFRVTETYDQPIPF